MPADDGWICPLCSADPDAASEAVEEFAGELCRGLDAAGVPGVPDAHTAVEQVQRRILAMVRARVDHDAALRMPRAEVTHHRGRIIRAGSQAGKSVPRG